MKTLLKSIPMVCTIPIVCTILIVCIFAIFSFSANAKEQRTNYYTQVTVYFAMNNLTEEYSSSEYMKRHMLSQAWIKQIMERTDTTMNLQQRGFGPYPLGDDPAQDSILNDEPSYGKLTLAYRAWYGMNENMKNPESPVYKKIQEIKELTGATVITVVIITNGKYYVDYVQNNIPIMIITNNSHKNTHLKLHNQMIFDSTSTKAIVYNDFYPSNHPFHGKEYETIFGWTPDLWIYPRIPLYKDEYGFKLKVGDEDRNVLDPDYGWKLHYLYNKGLLSY